MFKRVINISSARLFIRSYSTKEPNFFNIFNKTFKKGGHPKDAFLVDSRSLRKEYRALQSVNHPDILIGEARFEDKVADPKDSSDDSYSSILNKAYTTLKDPLLRSQYILKMNGIDVSTDDTAKIIMAKDKDMLMLVLEAHENLEMATSEKELQDLKVENDKRLESSEKVLNDMFAKQDYESAAIETVKLKYWSNISSAIRDWEPGKQVHLTH